MISGMNIAFIESMAVDAATSGLEDASITLVVEANRLAGRVHPIVQQSAGDLVGSTNC